MSTNQVSLVDQQRLMSTDNFYWLTNTWKIHRINFFMLTNQFYVLTDSLFMSTNRLYMPTSKLKFWVLMDSFWIQMARNLLQRSNLKPNSYILGEDYEETIHQSFERTTRIENQREHQILKKFSHTLTSKALTLSLSNQKPLWEIEVPEQKQIKSKGSPSTSRESFRVS